MPTLKAEPMSDGFLNLNKSSGMTSHDAVNLVRKIFGTRKVGHAGTLDPMATGVLPTAVGRATKFIEYLTDCDKSYRAEILFGTATATGDITGEVEERREDFSMPDVEELKFAAQNFVGEIEQVPPKFSAIKIGGRKAYDLARRNVDFEMPRRVVTINRLEILAVEGLTVTLEVDCSKGTYIRSLVVDFAWTFNLPATLKNLTRLRVGSFKLENSLTLEAIKKIGGDLLLPIDFCLNHLPRFELPAHRVTPFLNGLPTDVKLANTSPLRIYSAGKFLGVGKISDAQLRKLKTC